jgi:hypothetical protein
MTPRPDPFALLPGPWSCVRKAATYAGAGGLGLVLASVAAVLLAVVALGLTPL